MAEDHLVEVRALFEMYDKDQDNNLSLNELVQLLQSIEKSLTALPAVSSVLLQSLLAT